MPQRLTPLEVSLLALDTAHTPGHVGTVDIFDAGPDGFDYERLIGLIRERIAFVPRYRQRVRGVPARLAGPVWVDDENFDLTFHVRRSALPRPGTPEQLREFVGRVLARRLDRSRPLWEMYLVEGLADNRFALVGKSHLSLVDGIDTVDIGQVVLDADRNSRTVCRAAVTRQLASAAGAVAGGAGGRRAVGERPGPGAGDREPAGRADRRAGRRGGGRGGGRRGRRRAG